MDSADNISAAIRKLNDNMTMTVLPVTILIIIEMVIGFFGNILIFIVYYRHYEKSNFRIFVLFMAFVDFTSCLTTLPGEVFTQLNWYYNRSVWICRTKSFFNVFTACASASILVVLAVDRNRKVCRPLKRQMLPPLARKLCLVSLGVALVMAAPVVQIWGQQTYSTTYDGMNLTVAICEKSDGYKGTIYPFIYIAIVYFVPVGIMVVTVMVLNVLTAWTLFGHHHKRCALKFKSVSIALANTKSSCTSIETLATKIDTISVLNVPCLTTSASTTAINDITLTKKDVCDYTQSFDNGTPQFGLFEINKTNSNENINSDVNLQAKSISNNGCTQIEPSLVTKSNGNFSETSYIEERGEPCEINTSQQGKPDSQSKCGRGLSLIACCLCSAQSTKNMESIKRKTIIMLVLTSVFAITMATYVILVSVLAGTEDVLQELSNDEKVMFFFFFRLYFINTNINPILYGFMDPRFRMGLMTLLRRNNAERTPR